LRIVNNLLKDNDMLQDLFVAFQNMEAKS